MGRREKRTERGRPAWRVFRHFVVSRFRGPNQMDLRSLILDLGRERFFGGQFSDSARFGKGEDLTGRCILSPLPQLSPVSAFSGLI